MDEVALRSVARANGPKLGIKILGTGDLTKKLTVVVSAISASAKTKIEAKGGTVVKSWPAKIPCNGQGIIELNNVSLHRQHPR